jgi:hypothetical protein
MSSHAAAGDAAIPGWIGLLTLIPGVGLCGLIYLLWITEQEAAP